jgi:hypothetical protein
MEVLHGNGASPPHGHTFGPASNECAVEGPVTVSIHAGSDVERMRLIEGEASGAWRAYVTGETFDVGADERVLLRPRGSGGASVWFTWP